SLGHHDGQATAGQLARLLVRPELDSRNLWVWQLRCQIVQYRALGPAVAAAAIGQVSKLITYRLQLSNVLVQFNNILACQFLDICALAGAILPEPQQHPDAIQRKTQIPGSLYKTR